MAIKVTDLPAKSTDFIDTDVFMVAKDVAGVPTSQQFTWAELREQMGVAPKVYKALLTQTGTSAPVATVLVNTLSGAPTLTYGIAGVYNAELIGEFVSGKTFITIGGNSANASAIFTTNRYDVDNIEIHSYSGGLADDLLLETAITIEVYP